VREKKRKLYSLYVEKNWAFLDVTGRTGGWGEEEGGIFVKFADRRGGKEKRKKW